MTARGETTKQRLIDATTTLVREVGYANVTTRSIANAAGVAEGTLYRHFDDKRSLFFAAVMRSNAPIIAASAALPSLAGHGTVLGNLTDIARTIAQLQKDVVPLEQAMMADPSMVPDLTEGQLVHPTGPPHDIATYLAAEQTLGRVRADLDPTVTAIALLAMLFGLAVHPVSRGDLVGSPLLDASVTAFVTGLA